MPMLPQALSADLWDQQGLYPPTDLTPPPPDRVPMALPKPRALPMAAGNMAAPTPAPAPMPTAAQGPVTAPKVDVTGQGFNSAYADEIAAAQKRINDLESAPIGQAVDPNIAAARRAANSRMQQLGMVGILSGDAQMAEIGGQVLKTALARKQPHVTDQGMYDFDTGEYKMFPQVARAKQIDAERKNLERLQGLEGAQRATWQENRTKADERAAAAALRAQELDQRARERAQDQDENRQFRQGIQISQLENNDAARFDAETKELAGEINATQKIKQVVSGAAGRNLNAVEQQTVAVLLQKFLDPTSVVREGEYARAGEAAGMFDRAKQYADKIANGQFLPPSVIADISAMADLYRNAAQGKLNSVGDQYYAMSKRRGTNPENIVRSPYWQPPERRNVAPPPRAAAAPGAAFSARDRLNELRQKHGTGQ